jgi:hypothetical protein
MPGEFGYIRRTTGDTKNELFISPCVLLSYWPEVEPYLESWQVSVVFARSRRFPEIFHTFIDLKL